MPCPKASWPPPSSLSATAAALNLGGGGRLCGCSLCPPSVALWEAGGAGGSTGRCVVPPSFRRDLLGCSGVPPTTSSRAVMVSERAGVAALRLQPRRAAPTPLQPPPRGLGRSGGGCGEAALEEMGRESPGGGKPLQKYSRLHPALQEAPASPAPAALWRLALGWLGLTGSRKGPGATGGPPACQETPRNGHRSSPCSWHRPHSALPVPCCCSGLRSLPQNSSTGFRSHHGGTRPASPRAEPRPSPPGLPAPLMHSQVRGMKGGGRGAGGPRAAAWRSGRVPVARRQLCNAADQRCPWGLRSSMEATPALGVSRPRCASAPRSLIPNGEGAAGS